MLKKMKRKRKFLIGGLRSEDVAKLLQRTPGQSTILPQVGGEETVGVADGSEGGLEGVLEGLGGTGGGGVDVGDTSELEETLDGGGGDETGTTGSGNELKEKKVNKSRFYII